MPMAGWKFCKLLYRVRIPPCPLTLKCMIIDSSFIGSIMSKEEVERQIEIIKSVTKETCRTRESARQFLVDAGIFQKKDFADKK